MAALGNVKDKSKDMNAPLCSNTSTGFPSDLQKSDLTQDRSVGSSTRLPTTIEAPTYRRAGSAGSEMDMAASSSWVQRTLGPMTVGGVRHSSLTLASTALGGGVLAVSYVMQLCGMGAGLGLILISAVIAYVSIFKLMRMSVETGAGSYAALFSHCAGPRAGPILDTLLFIYGNGASVGYLVFLGDFIPAVFNYAAPDFFLAKRTWAIVAAACLTAPMALQRDTSILRYIAPVSIISLMYVAVVVTAQTPKLFSDHIHTDKLVFVSTSVLQNLPEAFSLCVFAFNCHMNVIPVARTMVVPTSRRIKSISCKVNTLQCMFYSLVGVTGYLSFLSATPGNLITAYSPKNISIVVARCMLTITMCVAIPMNFVPTMRSGLQLVDYFKGQQLEAETRPAGPRILMGVMCFLLQVFVAIKVPNVSDVLSLLGATVATAMMMAIPAYCIGVTMPKTATNRAIQALLYLFALIAVASVPIKVLNMAHVIKS